MRRSEDSAHARPERFALTRDRLFAFRKREYLQPVLLHRSHDVFNQAVFVAIDERLRVIGEAHEVYCRATLALHERTIDICKSSLDLTGNLVSEPPCAL